MRAGNYHNYGPSVRRVWHYGITYCRVIYNNRELQQLRRQLLTQCGEALVEVEIETQNLGSILVHVPGSRDFILVPPLGYQARPEMHVIGRTCPTTTAHNHSLQEEPVAVPRAIIIDDCGAMVTSHDDPARRELVQRLIRTMKLLRARVVVVGLEAD